MLLKRLQLKATALIVFFLFNEAFEKLVDNRIVDYLKKFGFRSSRSTADLLTFVSGRIANTFNWSGATRAVVPDISKAFERVWQADLLRKDKSCGILDQIFHLILWQQLELAFELESGLRDSVDWGRKWLVDFSARKTQLNLFDQSNDTSAIDVKMDKSVLKKKSSFKMMGLSFFSKLYWGYLYC